MASYSFLLRKAITALSVFLHGIDKAFRIVPEYSGASTAAYVKNDFIADIRGDGDYGIIWIW